MRKLSAIVVVFILLAACKSGKKSLSGEEPVTIEDFIEFFSDLELPYTIADTQINKKLPDSLLINPKVFAQFVPDTVYKNDYGAKGEPKLYTLGKVRNGDNETYLLVKAATQEKQVGYILCFGPDNTFKASMQLVKNNPDKRKSIIGSIDKRYTITTSQTSRGTDGINYYKLNAYVYNTAGVFTLIKIESNEPVVTRDVYNPIDSFPTKHKLSGDYMQDKKNFVSVRDGKDDKRLLFFIHFDSGKEECYGEVKGEAVLGKANTYYYRQVGDACVLELSFSNNKVTIREEQACGNYRGIKCTFTGTFPKKKSGTRKH